MISDNGLAAMMRILFMATVLAAAGFLGGCGIPDVGPEPLPWSPAEETPQSSGK